ncbi:MAG: SDR family oxidoreductase [Gammaproteobacteria bacterium]|nr:SDR family oxidoreductase [Gammaproteobacteria bacterium]MBT8151604.1 SDR family oxidoreductase [Gammaproteobacteria bacterium]NND40070.1 SDR family oxidoreductase [Pseudomonadales bacterium]NNM11322.1 SDR family oxidoreductase [Pseudomonadales bacterium]RZV52060.1 MAG: SDR family oxidoreductase [Pseudomonadales bacterium]
MTSTKVFTGKVAFITGAGQGIGQGIARSLAKRGCNIAAAGRTLEKCEQTCADIEKEFDVKALPLRCDVGEAADLETSVKKTVETLGGINILVNNAVSTSLGPLLSQQDKNIDEAFRVGPIATLKLMQLCHPLLVAAGGGSIINMASTAAKRWDMTNYGLYAAEKDAIRALTRAAASEWGKDNIRSNAILPHAKSPALAWWIDNNPEEAAAFISSIPMGRVGDCEADIGEFVAALCSPESGYVSGQSIAVDGGQAYMG